jgi:SAM-dependent methyltransferase
MHKLMDDLKYYLFTSCRRKMLDKALIEYRSYFKGKVIDIGGGRKDGRFMPPECKEWIIVDIDISSHPDVLASVEKLPFPDNTFDCIKATELFEHVENLEKGFSECVRVLKKRGHLVISTPFLFPIHGDPFDYQRITNQKWKSLAELNHLNIKIMEQGLFFTLINELWRAIVTNHKTPLRYLFYLSFPFVDLLSLFDKTDFVKKSSLFSKYVLGYFILLKK